MAEPDLHPVESTCVARIGYDREREEVHVEYRTGAVYGYRRVPPFVFGKLKTARPWSG